MLAPLIVGLVVATAAGASGAVPAHGSASMPPAVAPKAKPRPAAAAGSVLVRFRATLDRRERANAATAAGGTVGAAIGGTDFTLVGVEHGTATQLLDRLDHDPGVVAAVPNFIRRAADDPNDAGYWDRQAPLDLVRLPQAWSITHGSAAMKIAVVDTGVDLDQPDLGPRILPGKDFVNGDDFADDDFGHGTMVAGIAAATPNNGFGIAGASWNASIIPVKVLGADGSGTDADVAAGITWAADAGAKVINLSLGGPADSPVLRQAVDYAVAKDALVVAAAGNDGSTRPSYPAADPGVVAVASTNDAGESSFFSNHGTWVDIAAPGEDIDSTRPAANGIDGYATGSGTSFASPFVAGIAALVRSANPTWTQAQVAARLFATARDLGPAGIDDSYGHGLVDAAAALGAARQPALPPLRDALEPNGTPDEARAIGGGASATISPENDVDWFYVDVTTAGVWLTFTVSATEDASFDPALEAYTSDLRLLASRDAYGGGSGETLVVPANTTGRYYVRVSNYQGSRTTGAMTTRSDFQSPNYSVSVAQGSAPPGRFAPAEVYVKGLTTSGGEMNTWPQWVAIGDLNGDGRNDVVLATGAYVDPEHDNKVYVYPQLADGSLGEPTRLDPSCRGPTAEVGDLNGDGKADLAVACGDSGMKIYYQSGGQLGPPTTLTSPQATSFQILDVNRDGRNDLLTQGYDGIVVAKNTGTGFTTTSVSSVRGRVRGGDVTGDGRMDVVAYDPNPATVYVYPQNADGSFGAATVYTVPSNGFLGGGLEVADVTGDGRADVAVAIEANSPNARIEVFPQTAAGTLGTPAIYSVYDIPEPLAAADFDRDGRSDLVTAHGGWTHAGLLLQNASGGLQPEELYPITFADDYPNIAAGDVNRDGDLDIAIPDYNYGLVILRQYSRNLPPREQLWVRGTSPSDFATGVASTVAPTIRFARALDAASVSGATVSLQSGDTGAAVSASVSYDPATQTITVRPSAALASGPYLVTVSGVKDGAGNVMEAPYSFRFTTGSAADVYPPETMIWQGSTGTMSSSSLGFSFVSEDRTATFTCSLNGAAFTACTSPAVYSVTPGTYTFQVRAKDAAGNVDSTPARRRVVIVPVGQNPPDTWFAAPWPNGNVAGTSATFSLGSDAAGAAFECSLDGVAYTACSSPVTYNGLAVGMHTFSARAVSNGMVDPSPLAVAWTVTGADVTPPETTIASGPSGPTSSASATFTFSSSEAGSRFECSLDGSSFAACTSPVSYAGMADGSHTFRVRAIDAAGNVDATPAARSWTVDTTPPDTTISSGPSGVVASASASFGFSSSELGSTFQCSLDNAAFVTCTSPVSYTSLPESSHTFRVRAVDGVGNIDATPAARSWTVDTTPPDTTISSGPAGAVASSSASLTFASSEVGSTFECSLDNAAFARCSSPVSYSGLADGSHTFRVRAIDAAGNVDATPAARSWTVDTTPPETAITGGPSDAVATTSASFSFSAGEANVSFKCSLDGAAFGACSSPQSYGGLAEGVHAFRVEAIDAVGNVDPTPASRSWTIDVTPPQTTISSGPSGATATTSASFTFSASESSRFECALDGAAFAACTSPLSYSGLTDGTHVFRVRAVDAAGNVDATPAGLSWIVDTTPPETSITSGPSGSVTSTSASFGFTASETGSSFQCSLDGAAFSACTSPRTYSGLAPGSHTFEVWATDAVGNADATPAAAAWTIVGGSGDTTPPETTLTSGPAGVVSSSAASFGLSSTEPGSTFECSLDGAAFAKCSSPVTYSGLADALHTFRVRAVDLAGNVDATPAARSWTVDTTAPETAITSGPSASVTSTSASFEFTASETGSSFQCSLDGAAFGACASPQSYSALAVGGHTFAVRAIDSVGNIDPTPAAAGWTIAAETGGGAGGGGGSGGGGGGGGAGAGVLADLMTTVTAEPASPAVGVTVLLRVTVADKPGTGGATGVVTTITLPAALTFVRAEADRGPGCSLSGGARIVCDLDWVAPDAPATGHILVWATVNAAGTHHVTAATTENAGDQNPADNDGSLDLVVAGAFTPPAVVAPRATSRPTISGRPVVGAVLRASPGGWQPANPETLRYRWQRLARVGRGLQWRDVPGRTQRTIRLTRADVGKRLRVVVTGTNEAGTGTAASRPTPPVRRR